MARRGEGPRLRWRRGTWVIRWTDAGSTRERSTGTQDRAEAEAIFAEWLAGQRKRPQGLRRASDYLIADCLSDYIEEHGPEIVQKETLSYRVAALLQWWGTATVGDVTKATCQGYTAHRRKQHVKDSTIRRDLGVLSAAIGHAVDSGRLTERPKVWMPPPGPPRDRWLTRREAAALLRAARNEPKVRGYLPLFILFGLYTAARKQAILALRWPQVDLERRLIDFNPPGRTQTNKKRPKVPISRRLLTFLRLARRRGSDLGPVIHIDGRPIKDVKKGMAAAAIRAGLSEQRRKRNGEPLFDSKGNPLLKNEVSSHTLRHTSATWMAQAGVDMFRIAGYLGQSVQRTTEMYAHHHPDFQREAVEALSRHSVTNSVTNDRTGGRR